MTNLTEYQQEIIESDGDRIMMAGRQTGKTETIIEDATRYFDYGLSALVLAPRQDMAFELRDRFVEPNTDYNENTKTVVVGNGYVEFLSGYSIDIGDVLRYEFDTILVDEANMIDPGTLFEIERYPADTLLTATPRPGGSIVSMWAEHSPYWETFHVPTREAPFIDDENLERMIVQMNDERIERELEAVFKDG